MIDIDGLPADIDQEEYDRDPAAVIAAVREARAAASDLTGIHEEAGWDYDSLAAAFGEDDKTEVEG